MFVNATVIREVEREMLPVLDGAQMKRLHEALERRLGESLPKPQDNAALLKQFLDAKTVEGCSPRTIRYYTVTLEHFLSTLSKPLQSVTTEEVRDYLAHCRKDGKVSNVTIDNIRRIMSSMFSWLEDEELVYKSPVRRVKKIKSTKVVKPVISDESLEAMRDGCDSTRDLAIVDLLASTGMRVGELVRLKRSDIDFEGRECIVHGKGDKQRRVYFDARSKIHLELYLAERSDDSDALFVSLKAPYRPLEIGGVESRLRELGKRTIDQRIHPHKFRRTMATRAIDRGMPIEQVQVLLGHSKIETTLCYAQVDQQNVKRSHAKYIS